MSTDAGGGGTDEGLARDLRALNRLSPPSFFFGVTCCLHGHSLAFKSPVDKHFLLGGVSKRTVLQLLHAAYALENEFEIQDLRAVWLAVNNVQHLGKIMQPVLTRWSYAGEFLVKLLGNVENYKKNCNQDKRHLQSRK